MDLKESLADHERCLILKRLAYSSSPADVDIWQNNANTLATMFERVIQLRSPSFWSTIFYNSSVMESFDAALEALPRCYELDEYRLVYGWDPSVAKTANRLYYSTLALFLRLAVFNKDFDNALSQKEYLEFIRGRGVLPAKRLLFAISFFISHKQLMIEVTRKQSLTDSRLRDEITRICAGFDHCISTLLSNGDKLLEEFYTSEGVKAKLGAAKLVDDWFCSALAFCNEGDSVVGVLLQADLLQDPCGCVVRIPMLVENVARLFPTEVIVDVASTLPDYPLRRLLRLRAQLEQSAVKFYCTALAGIPLEKKIDTIFSALEMDRFVFLLNEEENLMELLKHCADEQREYVGRALQTAYDSQSSNIVSELRKCGLLAGLGDLNRLSERVKQAVQEVKQILPHLSVQYIHLCLRHFGYDTAQVVDALLERNERLPLALRLVENVDLTSTSTERPTLPVFSFENDEVITSLLSSRQQRVSSAQNATSDDQKASKSGKTFKGFISLAPILPEPSCATVVKNQTEEKPINKLTKELREALKRLKLHRAVGEQLMEAQQTIEDHERLVPMPTAKKYAGIQKFKISEADKVAIRPTYQKYYETPFDDNMYDDEYDDGYEQKEFTVEPLNAQLSSESSEEDSSGLNDRTMSNKGSQHGMVVDADRNPTVGKPTSRAIKGESGKGDKQIAAGGTSSRSNYTGGRQRQIKERHKNAFKQRGADRKMRGMY